MLNYKLEKIAKVSLICMDKLMNFSEEKMNVKSVYTCETTISIDDVLNKKESLLINLFIQNQGRIITYEEIEYHIWNNECTTAALKSLIRDLRKKTFKNIIKNYSGIGYKLELKNIPQQLS